jgi:hypothetical protein
MNWQYFKTNWFYMALGALVMFGIVRKYPHLSPLRLLQGRSDTYKSTENTAASRTGAALLGYVEERSPQTASSAELGAVATEKADAFLKRFAHVAVSERKKFGIPASVILAAAYANSQAGTHDWVGSTNNYFSLPCDESWEGERTEVGGKCLRRYETAWASFRDFSIYISSQEWTGSLKRKAGKDWRAWSEQLGKAGIANPKAMQKLIKSYRLYELDGV